MKTFKAWIVIDNETGEALLINEKVQLFWLKEIADNFAKIWPDLRVEKVEIKSCSTK